jgi:hypothetical protein
MSGGGAVQTLLEIIATIVVWAASLVFSHLGLEVDLTRPPAAERPAVQRTAQEPEETAAAPVVEDCPEAERARIRRV